MLLILGYLEKIPFIFFLLSFLFSNSRYNSSALSPAVCGLLFFFSSLSNSKGFIPISTAGSSNTISSSSFGSSIYHNLISVYKFYESYFLTFSPQQQYSLSCKALLLMIFQKPF